MAGLGENIHRSADGAVTTTISITESNTITALGNFLTSILPAGTAIVKGQTNRVSSPTAPNYVVMTPLMRTRLATNVDTYSDPFPIPGGAKTILTATRATIQMDVHGPASGDNAQIIMAMLRDDTACQSFAASGFQMQPLYATDPKQMPFITGEGQYEDRWTLDAELQANPVLTIPQDFAGTLDVGLINVDRTYPAGGEA